MNFTFGSLFRQASGLQIHLFMRQIARLSDAVKASGDQFALRLVWGDSTDGTGDELARACDALELNDWSVIERSHGGPRWGSTEAPERMAALSWVFNGLLDNVGGTDVFAFAESDLTWDIGVFQRLSRRLVPASGEPARGSVDMIAPVTFAGTAHYDIWGCRGLDGRRWSPFHPFHPDARFDGGLTEVGSAGSAFVMTGEMARSVRIEDGNAIVGFCASARAKGYRIYIDALETVHHPA